MIPKFSFLLSFFQIREEPPPPYSYSEPQSRESFENPMAGSSSRSYGSDDDEPRKSTGTRFGTALYDFTAGGDDEVSFCFFLIAYTVTLLLEIVCYDSSVIWVLFQLNLTAEEELEIEYEVDGWFYVSSDKQKHESF